MRIETNRTDSGTVYYDDNGEVHREDGPACYYPNGSQYWYYHGKRHRLDGPAIINSSYKAWYYYGNFIECSNQEEFMKILKLKAFW